jgi:hypothetical protein
MAGEFSLDPLYAHVHHIGVGVKVDFPDMQQDLFP